MINFISNSNSNYYSDTKDFDKLIYQKTDQLQ